MFVFGRRKTKPEDMRVSYCAPSFSLGTGEYLEVWSKAEAKAVLPKIRDSVVLVHPGYNLLSSPREWAALFSSAHFVVVCARPGDGAVDEFRREVEKVVFSPMRKPLSGIAVAHSREEAEAILSKFTDKTTVTIDNTGEVDL